jgi:hypothetical protein
MHEPNDTCYKTQSITVLQLPSLKQFKIGPGSMCQAETKIASSTTTSYLKDRKRVLERPGYIERAHVGRTAGHGHTHACAFAHCCLTQIIRASETARLINSPVAVRVDRRPFFWKHPCWRANCVRPAEPVSDGGRQATPGVREPPDHLKPRPRARRSPAARRPPGPAAHGGICRRAERELDVKKRKQNAPSAHCSEETVWVRTLARRDIYGGRRGPGLWRVRFRARPLGVYLTGTPAARFAARGV